MILSRLDLMMAGLCMSLTGIRALPLLGAHLPGVLLAGISFAVSTTAAGSLRSAELPALVVLVGASAAVLLCAGTLAAVMPRLFLGEHGRWAVDKVIAKLRRR